MWDQFIWITDTLLDYYVRLTNKTWFTKNFPSFSTEALCLDFSLSFKTESPGAGLLLTLI